MRDVRADDLRRHGSLGSIDKTLSAHRVHADGEILGDVFARLLAGETVAADNGGGVDLVLDQLISPLREWRRIG